MADVNNVRLQSVGMFYAVSNNEGAIAPDTDDNLEAGNRIAATEKPVELFSFVDVADNNTVKYVRLASSNKNEQTGATTYTYEDADVTAAAKRDGPDDDSDADQVMVTSGIPAAVAYQHIHFGAWAGLGEAAKNGDQKVNALGIGFVQSIGTGMTGADMPNSGTLTYNGDWAGTVQRAHATGEGSVVLTNGKATLTADIAKSTFKAELMKLATIEGKISGTMFSGTKAMGIKSDHGLNAGGTYTGSFSGGFYGAKGAEAADVFDFTSMDMKAGAFRGAFGGKKKE